MSRVSPRSRRHEDRAGDPLDGLVNMFDIGLVLAVAFLLAALASLDLSTTITKGGLTRPPADSIVVQPSDSVRPLPSNAGRTVGRGKPVGKVYRLDDGRLIYVIPQSAVPSAAVPTPSTSPS